MKKRSCFMLLLTFVLMFALTGTVFAAAGRLKAIEAYRKLLQKETIEGIEPDGKQFGNDPYKTRKMKFCLIDFNNDAIPELLIDNRDNKPLKEAFMIFTYKSGKVRQFSWIPSFIEPIKYYPKSKVIVNRLAAAGEYPARTGYSFIKKMKPTADWISIASVEKGKYVTFAGDKEVELSKAEFNKRLKTYVKNTKVKKIRLRRNTAAARKKYLK